MTFATDFMVDVAPLSLDRGWSGLYDSFMNLIPEDPRSATATSEEICMFAFLKAAGAIHTRLERALETAGLSLAKHGVLSHLAEAGEPLPLSELAGRLCCVRSNMTQLMDRLEAEGLVQRVDDPSDRRIVRAALTPLGAERQAAGERELEKVQAEFHASLSSADRAVLDRILAAIA
jgi:DNA-binding MarR family transcriptional regulator